MKKKFIYSLIIFLIILVIAGIILVMVRHKSKSELTPTSSNLNYPTAASQEYWSDIIPKKKIVPVFMTDKDKTALNISTSTQVNPEKIQILKRDASGKILEYKLIRTDADLVTSE